MVQTPLTETAYWLGFSRVAEIGTRRFALLRQTFGSAEAAWRAGETDLHEAGLNGTPLANLLRMRSTLDLSAELQRVARLGARVITQLDPEYPHLLLSIDDAPILLYVRGSLLPSDERALAIVGTRRASQYGLDVTTTLARGLAQHGVTIISGLAHGIDSAAHRAALEVNGRTIAVLGCGIDDVYPREHRSLAEQIAAQGAVITEFPPGAKPERHHFPRRNRIISGLSLGVLITEAPESSGALITATYAADQGRDVFAVPGSIFHASSAGANRLIQDGAKPVMQTSDILDELNLAQQDVEVRQTTERLSPGDETETQVLSLLGSAPRHIDEIVRESGLSTAVVSSTLAILELKGLARSTGNMQYCLPL